MYSRRNVLFIAAAVTICIAAEAIPSFAKPVRFFPGMTVRALLNRQEGEKFLSANKTRDGIVTLESGLQYEVLQEGDGPKPTVNDTVVVHYRGELIDGTEFANSFKRGQSGTFALTQVIPAWRQAIQLMPVGSRWRLFVPARLGYGKRGMGRLVGPEATLIFEMELLAVKESTDREARAGKITDIKVSFKLDSRLTRAQYLGDRWVSPPRFTSTLQVGKELIVEARARALNDKGNPMDIQIVWIPEDSEMVAVVPVLENKVRIIVKRPGESVVNVTAAEFTKKLSVKAQVSDTHRAMQVEIEPLTN